MKSIIKEIFYGLKGTAEGVKESEAYSKLYRKFIGVYERLKSKLSEELQKDFDLLNSLFEELEIAASDEHFVEGVKFGILLGIEACN